MKTTATELAATILEACKSRSIPVSNLKLQKLLYYCEAWSLALNDETLYQDTIEAWVHGPVVARVFRDYKDARWSPISRSKVPPSADPDISEHVRRVLDAYGEFGATELERLTHRETPWLEARRDLSPDEPSRAAISRKTMKEFYSSLLA